LSTTVGSFLDNDLSILIHRDSGEKGASDKAMRVLRSGGVYIILPGGGGGKISNNPKAVSHSAI
jgi:hypothetical protein